MKPELRQEVQPAMLTSSDIEKKVLNLVIDDPTDLNIAYGLLSEIKAEIEIRKEYFKPKRQKAKQVHDDWVAAEKKACQNLEQAKSILIAKMKAFIETTKKMLEEQYQKALVQAKEEGLNPALVPRPELRTSVKTRKIYKAVVKDFSKLPDEYKLPDMTKLNKLARDLKDQLNIPGVEVEIDFTII